MPSIAILLLLFYHFDVCTANFGSNFLLSKAPFELPESNYFKLHGLSGRTTTTPNPKQGSSSGTRHISRQDERFIYEILQEYQQRLDAAKAKGTNKTRRQIAEEMDIPYNTLSHWLNLKKQGKLRNTLYVGEGISGGSGTSAGLGKQPQQIPCSSNPTDFAGAMGVPPYTMTGGLPGPSGTQQGQPQQPPRAPSQIPGTSGSFHTDIGGQMQPQTSRARSSSPTPHQIAQIIARWRALTRGTLSVKFPPMDMPKYDMWAQAAGRPGLPNLNWKTLYGWIKSGSYENIPVETPYTFHDLVREHETRQRPPSPSSGSSSGSRQPSPAAVAGPSNPAGGQPPRRPLGKSPPRGGSRSPRRG